MPGSSVNNNDNNSVSTFDEKEVQTDNSNEDANMTVLSGNTIPGLYFISKHKFSFKKYEIENNVLFRDNDKQYNVS